MTPAANPSRADLLKSLRAFCFAVKHRSVSQAAKQVLSNQPTVSKWIRELETRLETELFTRSPAGITPTPAAERLYRHSAPLVHGLDRLPETFAERFRGEMADLLRIGAGQTSATVLLPRPLKRFQDSFPGVEIRVRVGDGVQRLEWLRHFEVDLVIGVADVGETRFECHPIVKSEFVLITPEDHPLAGRESVDLTEAVVFPGILPPADHFVHQVADMFFRQRGAVVNRALEVAGWNAIKRYVEAGIGISIIPEMCISDTDRVWRIPIPGAFPAREYSLIRRRDSTLPLAAERFIEIVESGTGDEG